MDANALSACYIAAIGWAPREDFFAVARAFERGDEPEPQFLSPPTRAKTAAAIESGTSCRALAEKTFAECAALGATVLHPASPEYPQTFFDLEKPPIFLSRLGGAPWMSRPTISIFGSREPSPAAATWLDAHVPHFLAKWDVCVASGGARGVDRRAHALAIASGRPTVVFLPSGLAKPYPADLATEWYARVVAGGGAILSEHPPCQAVRRAHFERRNRMIAALGRVAFAAEGRLRSGTTMTAGLARDLGRTLCALPGSPMDSRCAGTLELLRDGAVMICDALDLELLINKS